MKRGIKELPQPSLISLYTEKTSLKEGEKVQPRILDNLHIPCNGIIQKIKPVLLPLGVFGVEIDIKVESFAPLMEQPETSGKEFYPKAIDAADHTQDILMAQFGKEIHQEVQKQNLQTITQPKRDAALPSDILRDLQMKKGIAFHYLTIIGDDIPPIVVRAYPGERINNIVALAIGLHKKPRRVYLGNPYSGIPMYRFDATIPKSTTTLYIQDNKRQNELPCSRCGLCVDVCPVKTDPVGTAFGWTKGHCIACGKCDEICPEHIQLLRRITSGS
ncbi:hypothetical protein H6504_02705 [Candidatus Woesearchaeota archaeon]|nr:hypothetical protein [Candidatus Woesearchaeota archaeon]